MALKIKGRTIRPAFTMIELVFVIVILGILTTIAIPRLAASRDDAELVKGKNDIAAIRSSIITKRSQDILSGSGAKYPDLNSSSSSSTTELFGNVLDYPIYAKNSSGHWQSTSNTAYTFNLGGVIVPFDYNKSTGTFNCTRSNTAQGKACKELTQ